MNSARFFSTLCAICALLMFSSTTFAAECVRPKVSGYKRVACISDGLSIVNKDGKYGAVDNQGSVIIPLEYDYLADFSEGLAHAKKGNKKGYLDTKGNVAIPFEYDMANSFENGKAKVQKGEQWFYIDTQGKVVP